MFRVETGVDYQLALRIVIQDGLNRAALTQMRASRLAGMHPQYLGHVLCGTRPVTSLVLTLVAKVMDTTPTTLDSQARALCG